MTVNEQQAIAARAKRRRQRAERMHGRDSQQATDAREVERAEWRKFVAMVKGVPAEK